MLKHESRLSSRLGGVEKHSVEDCTLKRTEIEGIGHIEGTMVAEG